MKKILIVDDEADLLSAMKLYLENQGFAVETASGGYAAIQKAQSFSPDLILLDIILEETTGWQVLEKLREGPQTRDTPVVFMTAYMNSDLEKRIQESGKSSKWIKKPFDNEVLLEAIRKSLSQ